MRKRTVGLWLSALACGAQLAACEEGSEGRRDPVTVAATTATRQDALSYVGIERVIPLRFIMVPRFWETDPATFDQIRGAVQTANQAFRGAGVQFSIRSIEKHLLTSLDPVDATVPKPWGDFATPGSVAYELAAIFPSLPYLPSNPSQTDTAAAGTWMYYAATRGASSQDLVVWLTTVGNTLTGAVPWDGRGTMGIGSSLDDRWKFAHELGHVMGLSHPQIALGSLVCKPGADVDCDGQTQGMTTLADHWDMAYLPGTSAQSPHRTFNNRAEADAAGAGNLQWIDDGLASGSGNRCTVSWTSPGATTCVLPGQPGSGYSETWSTVSIFTSPTKLRGYMWPSAETRRATTVMPYRFTPPSSLPDWPAGFSDSETDLIRRNLRYDMKIVGNPWLQAAGATGGRPLLGRALRRKPADKLDFDGDGKRDLAVWEPPTSAGATGTFRVFLSGSTPPFSQQLTRALGTLGDTPVVADYNGDGVTDFAVVHDAGSLATNSGQLYWRACTSSAQAPPAPATHSCVSPSDIQWGDRGDIPIPGTRFSPTAAGELTVYRPSDGNVYVRNSVTGAQTTIAMGWGGYTDQAPFVGSFDGHPGSDVAVYDPRQGEFRLRLSGSGWATPVFRSFCPGGPTTCAFVPKGTGTAADRGGAVPVWGLQAALGWPYSTAGGALALWDPSNGNWSVMWSPLSSSTIETHQWGVSGDTLVGDAVGLGATVSAGQRSNLVVYRSDSTAGPGTFYRCAFPQGAGTCPWGAAYQSIDVAAGQRRTDAFAVADMVGDGKPELCAYAADLGTVRCFTSDSGYTTTLSVTFPSPAAQFL